MTWLFWCCCAVVGYTYAGYPACMVLLARLRPRPWKQAEWKPAPAGVPVSIIMAVYNGADSIAGKVSHLLALDSRLVQQIVIVSDGSTDGTAEICRQAQTERVRVIELTRRSGKAAALAAGIGLAAGEILLFIDLRARLAPQALDRLLENFADEQVGCAGGELHLLLNDADRTVGAVGGLYWRYERWLRSVESIYDSSVGLSGCFFAARRSLVTVPPDGLILDDVFQPLSIIRKGYRSVVDTRAIVTDILPKTTAGEFARKVRTLAGNYQLLSDNPWIFSFRNRVLWQFVSHKLLRLVVPYMVAGMLVSSAIKGFTSRAFAIFALLQALVWLSAALNLKTRVRSLDRLLGACRALLVLNAAAVAGLYVFLFTSGPLWKIWSPEAAAKQ